ncbi:MAG: hypothetical protein KA535_03390 [Azonexus sp.]|nr:hypothetical protein [Azonexus sp.]
MTEFETVADALNELTALAASVDKAVKELQDAASDYADSAAHARRRGDKVPPYSGSAQQKQLDAIVTRLKAATNNVQFIGTELVRFGG